jgi:hypothetical protein
MMESNKNNKVGQMMWVVWAMNMNKQEGKLFVKLCKVQKMGKGEKGPHSGLNNAW